MRSQDPYTVFRFVVEINGTAVGGFSEATGLESKTEADDYREGGVNNFVHKMPKETRYPNLVLKRGLTDSTELWDWYQDVVQGFINRKTISVVLLDSQLREKWRLIFRDAFPVRWASSDMNASGSSVAVQTVEFAHHGMTKL